MNIILFEAFQEKYVLPCTNSRYLHIKEVLRMKEGDSLYVGVVNGSRYKARICEFSGSQLVLEVTTDEGILPVYPVDLLIGLPRPQTARKILQAAATYGVRSLSFFCGEKSEPSYGSSKLWSTDEWRGHLVAGAEQAFATAIPKVSHYESLKEALSSEELGGMRLALDNYEAVASTTELAKGGVSYVLALGPERGWSGKERDLLRESGFVLAHLGPRALRLEQAMISSISLVLSSLGVF